jgi:hypothetical protein
MTPDRVLSLLEQYEVSSLKFVGHCHDCGKPIEPTISLALDMTLNVSGGAVYEPVEGEEKFYIKCDGCFAKEKLLTEFQQTEVYSRIVGYMRPTSQWNQAKLNEFNDRKMFKQPTGQEGPPEDQPENQAASTAPVTPVKAVTAA